MTDGGIGVFLIMRGPGFPSGMTTDALVSQVDIYPTICDLIQLSIKTRKRSR